MTSADGGSAAGAASRADLFGSLFADLPLRVGLLLRGARRTVESVTAMADLEPGRRRYLGLDPLTERYGAPADAEAAVRAFATQQGLDVLSVHRAGRLAVLEGPGERVRQAFSADLEVVAHGSGHRHRAASPVAVPAALETIVEHVFGLETTPRFGRHSNARSVSSPDGEAEASTEGRRQVPPREVATRYHFPANRGGAGQTLAILVLGGGFYEDDLRRFFGDRMPRIHVVEVGGATNDPAPRPALDRFIEELKTGQSPSATGEDLDQLWWTVETTVDIELAGSFAPEAELVVYFAPNTELGKIEGITAVIAGAAHDPDVLSCSWGAREADLGEPFVHALDGLFQVAALRGISLCYSSGDKGSDVVDGHPSARFPASSPHVLAIGGTTFDTGVEEFAWDESRGDLVLASGGGFSRFFDRPSWQVGVSDGGARRGVPDVAGKADYAEGYALILGGRSIRGGGTSSAAPMWAGLVTRLGEALGARLGWLPPWIYGHSEALNPVAPSRDMPATAGWHPATGLGSPDGEALLRALKGV